MAYHQAREGGLFTSKGSDSNGFLNCQEVYDNGFDLQITN